MPRTLIVGLLLAGLGAACSEGPATVGGGGPVLAAEADDPQDFGAVPPFALTSQAEETVTRETLAGRPYAVAAIFTRCAGPCPRITASMRRLQDALADTDVRLVSVSVDPGFDRPAVLRDYAAAYTADLGRWTFLTGTQEDVTAFLKEGLWLPLARAADPDVDPGQAVTHSTKIVAVDRQGRLRGWYDGTQEDDVERLSARLRFLAGEDDPGPGGGR